MLKLTGYPSSSFWYAKLCSGINGLVMVVHFPKVIKGPQEILSGAGAGRSNNTPNTCSGGAGTAQYVLWLHTGSI